MGERATGPPPPPPTTGSLQHVGTRGDHPHSSLWAGTPTRYLAPCFHFLIPLKSTLIIPAH